MAITRFHRSDVRMQPQRLAYAAFRCQIRTGDIALSRSNRGPLDQLISLETGSPYVHATMLGWCGPRGTSPDAGGVLMLAEARQWRESRLVTFSSQVKRWPGLYDIYRVRQPFRAAAAWTTMLRATGSPYGWRQVLRELARKLFGRGVLPGSSPSADDFPRDCSALVNFACRAGGRAPRPDLPDEEVEPGHFAAPSFARYLGTIYWTDAQVEEATRQAALGEIAVQAQSCWRPAWTEATPLSIQPEESFRACSGI